MTAKVADGGLSAPLSRDHLKELIDFGEYGELFLLDAMMDENLRGCADLCWPNGMSALDGGVFCSALPTVLDASLWIGGLPGRSRWWEFPEEGDMGGEDMTVSVMRCAGGAIGATKHS